MHRTAYLKAEAFFETYIRQTADDFRNQAVTDPNQGQGRPVPLDPLETWKRSIFLCLPPRRVLSLRTRAT